MSSYLGDYQAGCTLFDVFTTTDTSGRPTGLAGSPSPFLVVYKDAWFDGDATTGCTVAGVVLALNCNGLTGVNAWSVNTNLKPSFYSCGNQYQVLLRGGCVDSICVSGYVVGRFSLNKDSSLKPLIHGRNRVSVTAANEILADPCSAIFSVQKLIDRPIVDACSAIFSVQRIVDPDTILDKAIVQPTAVFSWPTSLRGILGWLGALSSNCLRQTAILQTLRARDDLSSIATANLTCEASTVHRGSFT